MHRERDYDRAVEKWKPCLSLSIPSAASRRLRFGADVEEGASDERNETSKDGSLDNR